MPETMNRTHYLMRLASRVFDTPLLIHPDKAAEIVAVLGSRIGVEVEPQASMFGERRDRKPYAVTDDGVAVIDVSGTLTNRSHGLEAWSGMSTYEQISNEVLDAATDPAIRAILLRVDSPGGEVAGAFDCAELIADARSAKEIWAAVDDCACSAAYLLASACSKVMVSRTGLAGSIGVIAMHRDTSKFDEIVGFKYTTVSAGARKNDLNPHEPITDEALKLLKADIDAMYGLFTKAVAKNRAMDLEAVVGTEAAVYRGGDGVRAGLANQILSFRDALGALTETVRTKASQKGAVSAAQQPNAKETTKMMEANAADALEKVETPAETPKEVDPNDELDDNEVAAVAADPGLVMDLVALAGFDLSIAREMVGAKLSADEVRARLLGMKRTATDQNKIRSSVAPAAGNALNAIQRSAEQFRGDGVSNEQAVARALRANPALYANYLKENPAQTGQA